MKKCIILLFLILVLNCYALEEGIFRVEISYQNNTLYLKEIKLINYLNYKEAIEKKEGYKIELISFSGNMLKSYYFEIPTQAFIEEIKEYGVEGKSVELDGTDFSIYLPYYPDAKTINVYSPDNNLLINTDVSEYSKGFCGDGICQEDEKCNEDCAQLEREGINFKNFLLYTMVIVIFIAVIFILINVKRTRLKR